MNRIKSQIMKTTNLIFLIFILMSLRASSQVINEDVLFDTYINANDNDLLNYFSGNQTLVQIPTNGITGGCLQTPDSNNWGNDNSRYCSKYQAVNNQLYTTSICFYYDPALISATGFDRATSIWVQPNTDFNHYLIASVSHAAKIEIYTYFSFTSSISAMNLLANNWYRLELGFSFTGSPNPQTNFYSKINLLGPAGVSSPVLVDSIFDSMNDTILQTDPAIDISITGSKNGGSMYLDNFKYQGVRSVNSCNLTDIEHTQNKSTLNISVTNKFLLVEGALIEGKKYSVYDMDGKTILSDRFNSNRSSINLSFLSSGIYFISVSDMNEKKSNRFIIQ